MVSEAQRPDEYKKKSFNGCETNKLLVFKRKVIAIRI